jgi:hypothetical protein
MAIPVVPLMSLITLANCTFILLDDQRTFVQQGAVQSGNGFVCIRRTCHLHKAEPAWLARFAVGHNADPVHWPECCEQLTERLFRRAGT